MELTPQPASAKARPSAARNLGKAGEIFMGVRPPKTHAEKMGNSPGTASRKTKILFLLLGYLAGFAGILTGAPWLLASTRIPAQLASFAKPGSTKAKSAANGTSKPRPAPIAPCASA